jgi:hypothetical protein
MSKAGRPTKYSKEIPEKAREYADTGYKEAEHTIPSIAGLARVLGVHKDTLYEWAKHNPKFSDALKEVSTSQELAALNGGVSGDFNPTITKLVLHNHGYHDKAELDNKSSDGSMSPPKTIQLVGPDE